MSGTPDSPANAVGGDVAFERIEFLPYVQCGNVDQVEFAEGGSRSAHSPNAQAVAAMGEPYLSGFDPAQLACDLKQVGLELIEDLNGPKMSKRYRTNALRPTASMHIALARVAPVAE